jgi:hypothetical protein
MRGHRQVRLPPRANGHRDTSPCDAIADLHGDEYDEVFPGGKSSMRVVNVMESPLPVSRYADPTIASGGLRLALPVHESPGSLPCNHFF